MQKFLTLTVLTATLSLTGLAQASTQADRAHHARENAVTAMEKIVVYSLAGSQQEVVAPAPRPAHQRLIKGGRGSR